MPIDIYLKVQTDPNFSPYELEEEDDLERFIQAVDMILTTKKGEILGEPGFGSNLEEYLWNFKVGSNQIKSNIISQIETYCSEFSSNIPYDIAVNFIKGDIYDSIIVDLEIDGTKVLGIAVRP